MYDIVIIGGGPAGTSAAIFTAKAGKKTLVLDNDKSVTKRAWMENHFGSLGISGPDLMKAGEAQAAKFGAEYVITTVMNIQKTETGFVVETEDQTFETGQVLLATGMITELAEKIGVETKAGTEPRIKTVIAVDAEGRTNVANIWAAGTVAGVSMHTIVTAGDGAKVAINIISQLNGERYVDHDVFKG